MINFNGSIIAKDNLSLDYNNRAFSYGDSVFDTSKFVNNEIQFIEDHYFRLMASMRMLRMEIPMEFTLDFFESEIRKTIKANNFGEEARIKFTVFRNSGGFYLPTTHKVNFIVEVSKLQIRAIEDYSIDLFKDFYLSSSLLSTIKTNNRMLNVVASIYSSENNLDNCLLLNEKKNVVEAVNGNVFLIKGNEIHTPPVTDGCIKGIVRKKVIETIKAKGMFLLKEISISPFDLLKADSLFITNSIIGIQEVKKYRKKTYNSYLVDVIKADFDEMIKSTD